MARRTMNCSASSSKPPCWACARRAPADPGHTGHKRALRLADHRVRGRDICEGARVVLSLCMRRHRAGTSPWCVASRSARLRRRSPPARRAQAEKYCAWDDAYTGINPFLPERGATQGALSKRAVSLVGGVVVFALRLPFVLVSGLLLAIASAVCALVRAGRVRRRAAFAHATAATGADVEVPLAHACADPGGGAVSPRPAVRRSTAGAPVLAVQRLRQNQRELRESPPAAHPVRARRDATGRAHRPWPSPAAAPTASVSQISHLTLATASAPATLWWRTTRAFGSSST